MKKNIMKTKWTITCPECGHKELEKIPDDNVCIFMYANLVKLD